MSAGSPNAVFLSHPASLRHETGAHPERPQRIVAIESELARRGWLGLERVSSPAADRSLLEAVHPASHVSAIEALSLEGPANVDPDTVVGPGSWEAALHAAGGACRMVDLLLCGQAVAGFSAHRPPGHHAQADRAMGFCLFNNAAVAAQHALNHHGLQRVLIVDWDVHHGNGTNDIFHASPEVLFASIHQRPLYPGSGAASDIGSGAGEGHTVNLPVAQGSGDEQFASLVEHVVVALARCYEPQLVLVCAGYDAHRDDRLAGCRVTEAGYAQMTRSLQALGAELGAPLGIVLEGGYQLEALAGSVAATLEVLTRPPSARQQVPVSPLATAALERLSQHWPDL